MKAKNMLELLKTKGVVSDSDDLADKQRRLAAAREILARRRGFKSVQALQEHIEKKV